MKIMIATGIYPPEIGGPALYAQGIYEALETDGHIVSRALFAPYRKYPSGIRHALYTINLFRRAWRADAILAFDTGSVGVPSAFVGMILRIPVVVRVGGDWVWEQYLERTHDVIPLPLFYTAVRNFSLGEKTMLACVRFLTRHAHLAFNTPWLRDIWEKPYQLDMARTSILENIVGEKISHDDLVSRSILFYSRQIVLKNIPAFRRAFDIVQKESPDISLETGSITHENLLLRMRTCYAVAIPSVSEVAPNTLIDALRRGKPCILSKYSGYAERFKDMCILVDPLDEEDMARGIREIYDTQVYDRLVKNIRSFRGVRTYAEVAHELIFILEKI